MNDYMSNIFQNKKCFIITPIGSERSEIRDALDGLLKNVLEPVLLELGFDKRYITVAHQMKDSGSINTQIITRIVEDDLCIVNLTGLNPNVMYELAVRHAVGKPVVIIAENGTKLPFDIIDQRTIFYANTMLGAVHLKETLKDMVNNIYSTQERNVDNPIIKIIKDNAILDKITSDGTEHSELSLVLDKIANLESRFLLSFDNRNLPRDNSNKPTQRWILQDKNNRELNEFIELFNINSGTRATLSKLIDTDQIIVEFFQFLSNKEIFKFEKMLSEKGVKILDKYYFEMV